MLTSSGGRAPAVDGQFVLAKGDHAVKLSGRLDSAESKVELRWSVGNAPPAPVASRFLWGGPQGALLCQSYAGVFDDTWFTAQDPSAGQLSVLQAERTGMIAWPLWPGQSDSICRGTLNVPVEGNYVFSVGPSTGVSLWVDGKLALLQGLAIANSYLGTSVNLGAGAHSFELRLGQPENNASTVLLWQPPGGRRWPCPRWSSRLQKAGRGPLRSNQVRPCLIRLCWE